MVLVVLVVLRLVLVLLALLVVLVRSRSTKFSCYHVSVPGFSMFLFLIQAAWIAKTRFHVIHATISLLQVCKVFHSGC